MKGLSAGDPRWIGDYRLLGRLGEGGMGRVYLARSGRGRTVAVKAVQDELARQPDFRRRFAQEITAARKVGGTWTAPVLDADTEAATPWVATGYIAGPSLSEVVDDQFGPLPHRTVTGLASGLVRALGDIHRAGLVHRDLKPSNILITIDGPRVIDFGIARALDSAVQSAGGLTQTGALVGSPGFMSPEQVRGTQVTPASDIFCLGAVLAYAATGRMPFGTADSGVHALLFRIAEEEPELSGLEGPLREMVVSCLAKKPGDRPALETLMQRTEGELKGTWLPGEVLAELGRHAVQLLDSEDPESVEQPRAEAVGAAGPAPAASGPAAPSSWPRREEGAALTPSTPPPAAPQGPSAPPPSGRPAASTPPPHGLYGPPAPGPYSPLQPPPQPPPQQPWQAGFPGPAPGPAHGPAPGPVHGPAPGGPGGARPAQPLRPAVSPRRIAHALTVLLGLHLLIGVIAVVVDGLVVGKLDSVQANVVLADDLRRIPGYGRLRGATVGVETAEGLLALSVIVLWLVWFWRVRVNAENFAPGRVRYSSAMAVGSWFVPVCNLFMPKQVMNDVWSASDPSAPQWQGYGPKPRVRRGIVNGWWTMWLFYFLFSLLDYESWYGETGVEAAQETVAVAIFTDFFSIPATILALVLVGRLSSMQSDRLTGRVN
ncbi:DUF4328 domain-containing protein [Streptomyces sp. WMMB 322]|uniref:protein kinase domain-containing protein n=1 Tax=Streptomyces sp. WMMB 322 TaxID=1286821 RepID=UPI0006E3B498|nr:DUF4328 domain-containing protein [Streptomyces sp. WMMB 322]SCK38420.1 Serine/threonine protein kinase [Streptomyces sp. WMMB 322]